MGFGWAVAVVKVLTREFGVGVKLPVVIYSDVVELAEEIGEVVYRGVLVWVLPFGIGVEVTEESPPFSRGFGRGLM